jgi:hypothetical protein
MAIKNITELFAYNDETFVKEAYGAILKRSPDTHGLAYYVGRLNLGYSKESVIVDLARSAEAGDSAQQISGLNKLVDRYYSLRSRLTRLFFARKKRCIYSEIGLPSSPELAHKKYEYNDVRNLFHDVFNNYPEGHQLDEYINFDSLDALSHFLLNTKEYSESLENERARLSQQATILFDKLSKRD